jgi:hypothetical protein
VEWFYEILNDLREDALREVANPPEDRRTEFGYGRISGMLLMIETIRGQVANHQEAHAQRQERFEREF